MNRVNDEFFKIQREASLQEGMGRSTSTCSEVLLKLQEVQLKHLTKQLDNSESLNDVNIEASFHLEEEAAAIQHMIDHTTKEVLSLLGQKGEAFQLLNQLQ